MTLCIEYILWETMHKYRLNRLNGLIQIRLKDQTLVSFNLASRLRGSHQDMCLLIILGDHLKFMA